MKKYVRKGIGKADGGSAWISYSDMMAALILIFVLILCYSMYQYFTMLETKTAELDEQSARLTAQEETLTAQQATLNEQSSRLSAQQEKLDSQQTTLDKQTLELASKQAALLLKEQELDTARGQLDIQQNQLDQQNFTLQEQQAMIVAAQAQLSQKEAELEMARAELAAKQQSLNDATSQLGQQQMAMDQQQRRLDSLVGVRTQIVRELTSALERAHLKASVDKNTGDIMLESSVFFDHGKSEITEDGQAFLDRFIPVYLGVLLRGEYSEYLGEIVIEGHTDSSGDYLTNLEISQNRALAVAKYCLDMPNLSGAQLELLQEILTAKGRSESDLIYDKNGRENADASRRVEFKFRMKDSEMIDEIRSILSEDD